MKIKSNNNGDKKILKENRKLTKIKERDLKKKESRNMICRKRERRKKKNKEST